MMDFLYKILGLIIVLALLAVGTAVIVGIVALFRWLILVLPSAWLFIIFILLLVGMNTVTFFESYVWENRKSWYFPMTLSISVIAVIVIISVFVG